MTVYEVRGNSLAFNYKGMWIHTHQWHSEVTGKSGEIVWISGDPDSFFYQNFKSVHAAKCFITRFKKSQRIG